MPHRADGQAADEVAPLRTRCVITLEDKFTATSLTVDGAGAVSVGLTASGGANLVRSQNQGETWDVLRPGPDGTSAIDASMGWIVRDPTSGRLFASGMGDPSCPKSADRSNRIAFTDDGDNWTVVSGQLCDTGEWGRTFIGPAATDAGRATLAASGYPNVVYHCAGADERRTRQCWHSYDGGATWMRTATDAITGQDATVAGAGRGPDPCPDGNDPHQVAGQGVAGQGVVAPDGTVYLPVSACGRVAMTVSRDEGASWALVPLPFARTEMDSPFSQQLAVDGEGNLYFAWVDASDQQLRVATSSDSGSTWRRAIVVSPPGVQRATVASIVVAEPGHVALAYYASKDGDRYDGFVTEVRGALTDAPQFESAEVSPHRPLQPNGISQPIEHAGIAFAPDGSVWASFAEDLCVIDPKEPRPQCGGAPERTTERFPGRVLRLA